MKNIKELKISDAKSKEEKIIVELIELLMECCSAFVNLNKSSCTSKEIIICIANATVNFAGLNINFLMNFIDDESQKADFLNEAQDIFNQSIEQAIEDIKK